MLQEVLVAASGKEAASRSREAALALGEGVHLVPARPLLAPWFRRADGDGLLFGYGDEVIALSGRAATTLLPRLLPLLDGTRDVDAIVGEVGEAARPAVEAALATLARQGLLTGGPPLDRNDPRSGIANLVAAQSARVSPFAVAQALEGSRVDVRGGGATAEAIVRCLVGSGIGAATRALGDPVESDLVVVAPRPDELPELAAWNARAVADRIAWLVVLPFDGAKAFVGPLFVADESGCYECLRIRRAANVPYPDEFRRLDEVPAPYPVAGPLDDILAGLAGLAVARWLGAGDPLFVGAAYALEAGRELGLTRHVVYPVPRCPACSPLAGAGPVTPWFG